MAARAKLAALIAADVAQVTGGHSDCFLGLEPGGLLRIGLLHDNTHEEVQRRLSLLLDVGRRQG